MLNISPGIIIAMAGLAGLMFTFVDSSGEVGSKIPLTLFFLLFVVLGIVIEMYPKDKMSDIYGEFGEGREYG